MLFGFVQTINGKLLSFTLILAMLVNGDTIWAQANTSHNKAQTEKYHQTSSTDKHSGHSYHGAKGHGHSYHGKKGHGHSYHSAKGHGHSYHGAKGHGHSYHGKKGHGRSYHGKKGHGRSYHGKGKKAKNLEKDFRRPRRTQSNTPSAKKQSSMMCPTPGIHDPYRTIDGTCNNLTNTEWGAADIPLFRELLPLYGPVDPNNSMGGVNRPNPRALSNAICSQPSDVNNNYTYSAFVFTWGQFLDHDIDLTPEGESESVPILLPADEPLFGAPIPFHRSEARAGTSPREQTNLITSWIDGSNVYGSDSQTASWLRTNTDGKLKTSSGNLLPFNTTDNEATGTVDPTAPGMAGASMLPVLFVAGDVRANEQPGLTMLHTLFVREHNRLCDELKASNPTWNDEQLYQEARKRVSAIIQAITFNEFLPTLGVHLPAYAGYRDDVRPDIMNLFATAAYRMGHTMVTDHIQLLDPECNEVGTGSLSLKEAFFNPTHIQNMGLEPFIGGLCQHLQQEMDQLLIDDLRNFLFSPAPGSPGLDLAALNIHRGRDHGLADYNTVRTYFTNAPVNNFFDITSNANLAATLESMYTDVNDIDLWVGLLAEDHLPGMTIGFTLHAILQEQFTRLRDADFYYYKNDPTFTTADVSTIDLTRLSDIILRNTEIDVVQRNVFLMEECNSGYYVQSSIVMPKCGGSCDGSIDVAGMMGCDGTTYTYLFQVEDETWLPSTGIETDLCSGNYRFRVTDACGNTITKNFKLNTPENLQLRFLEKENMDCNGAGNGMFMVEGRGGTPPYQYSIDSSNFSYSNLFTGLSAGDHIVTVRDIAGCTATRVKHISEPDAITLSVKRVILETCAGTGDGEIRLDCEGGKAPFEFTIDDGATWQHDKKFRNLTSGSYTILVRDSNGCTASVTETVGANACKDSEIASPEEPPVEVVVGKIQVAPNPATDHFNLQLNVNETSNASILIVNIAGKIVYQAEQVINNNYRQQFDTTDWATGLYFVNVKIGQQVSTEKLLVQ